MVRRLAGTHNQTLLNKERRLLLSGIDPGSLAHSLLLFQLSYIDSSFVCSERYSFLINVPFAVTVPRIF